LTYFDLLEEVARGRQVGLG